jgi:hypothetical protein
LYDATDNLINQQFYRGGEDLIIGRTADVSVKIRNSGQIIQKFKNMFNSNLHQFIDGNYLEFLQNFIIIKGLNEKVIQEINKEFYKKMEYLKDTEIDQVVVYTIVLSALITRIRDDHFNTVINEVKTRIKNKVKIKAEKIQEELNKLFMRNNKNISLLYNLSYIDALAESFNYKKAAHTCKIQKGKYINRTVDLIISASK